MFTMKQFERVGGNDCASCLFLLLKETTGESTVYLPALYAERLLCIDMMFIYDLIRRKEVTFAIVLKLCKSSQGWREG